MEEIRAELTRRKEAFLAMQAKYNGRLKKLIILILAAASGIGGAFAAGSLAGGSSPALRFCIQSLAVSLDRPSMDEGAAPREMR